MFPVRVVTGSVKIHKDDAVVRVREHKSKLTGETKTLIVSKRWLRSLDPDVATITMEKLGEAKCHVLSALR